MKTPQWFLLVLFGCLVSLLLGSYQLPWDAIATPFWHSQIVQVQYTDTPAAAKVDSDVWLLEFPRHWVREGRCQVDGTMTALLTRKGPALAGQLHWIWNGQNSSAAFQGQLGSRRVKLSLLPPQVGGFEIRFQGKQTDTDHFVGKAMPQGVCKFFKEQFTLTRLPKTEKPSHIRAIPIFQKPFDGEYLVSNYFDHDVPRQFVDRNGYMVNWHGDRLPIGSPGAGIDGHGGYDWGLPENTPLLAVSDGEVTFAGEGQAFFCPPLNQTTTGQYVYILHTAPTGEHFESEYVHLNRVDVRVGDRVRAGQVIGTSGNTGCSTGPHLHFGVRRLMGTSNRNKVLVDPYGWSAHTPDPWTYNQNTADSVWLWKNGQAPVLYEYGKHMDS